MRNRTILTGVFAAFLSISAIAQKNPAKPSTEPEHTIKVKVAGIQDTVVYLANYYGNKLFYNDTAYADANGYAEFKGKSFEQGGKFALVVPGPKYFDFLVSDEDIHLETDVNDFMGKMKVIKSEENRLFFEYIRFIEQKKALRVPQDAVLADENVDEKKKEEARKNIEQLNAEVIAYQKEFVTTHADKLAGKLVKMTMDVEIPEPPAGNTDPNWTYHYYIDHYWDNTDLTDPRIVRDQIIHKKLEFYANNALAQIPDTICTEAISFINGLKGNPDLFKYAVHFFTSNAEKSKIMCMDKVFVCLVDEYYRTGQADWMDQDALDKILESAENKRYSLCGEQVPDVILPDTTEQNWVSLHSLKNEYTILAIWESDCGHCKKELPSLLELYHKWKPKGVEVYAICNDFETAEWKKFVKKNDLDWINVSDNPAINNADSALVLIRQGITTLQSLNFRKTFDVFSTPKLFVLDKDKKVVAKQLSSEQIDELLERLMGEGKEEEKTKSTSEKAKKPKAEKAGKSGDLNR